MLQANKTTPLQQLTVWDPVLRSFHWLLVIAYSVSWWSAIQQRLADYRAAGAADFDAARGAALWQQSHIQPKQGKAVSCRSCHSTQLQHTGQHLRTGKLIELQSKLRILEDAQGSGC